MATLTVKIREALERSIAIAARHERVTKSAKYMDDSKATKVAVSFDRMTIAKPSSS